MIRFAASVFAFVVSASAAVAGCAPLVFEAKNYIVCRFDLATNKLALFNLDAEGRPFGSFAALETGLAAEGRTLAFAMNAGMYNDRLRPVGLYVENGVEVKALNTRKGRGNFHLMPNGVFYVAGNTAGVADSQSYRKLALKPDLATQSGPMLVINGSIHPAFSPDGTSLKIRNGVGVANDLSVVFAISEEGVRFHDFARLFRDELRCPNALFLDGSVSGLYSPELGRDDVTRPLGPIIAVVK